MRSDLIEAYTTGRPGEDDLVTVSEKPSFATPTSSATSWVPCAEKTLRESLVKGNHLRLSSCVHKGQLLPLFLLAA